MKPENTIHKERLPANKQQFDADLSAAIVGARTHNAEKRVLSKLLFKNENKTMPFLDKN